MYKIKAIFIACEWNKVVINKKTGGALEGGATAGISSCLLDFCMLNNRTVSREGASTELSKKSAQRAESEVPLLNWRITENSQRGSSRFREMEETMNLSSSGGWRSRPAKQKNASCFFTSQEGEWADLALCFLWNLRNLWKSLVSTRQERKLDYKI